MYKPRVDLPEVVFRLCQPEACATGATAEIRFWRILLRILLVKQQQPLHERNHAVAPGAKKNAIDSRSVGAEYW